jgi:hypothetical protein
MLWDPMRKSASLLALLVGSTALLALPRRADACGGCFHEEPPTPTSQTNSVVTDHRMVVALSSTATTLWDQIEYVGDPTEFAWVLPIRGSVVVGVGSNSFIDSLDTATAPVVVAPAVKCKPYFNGYGGDYSSSNSGCGCASTSSEDMSASPGSSMDTGAVFDPDTGVVVTGQSVVGPYETVQIHGTDPGSIVGWLRAHKYAVPTDIEPILKKYVDEGFDFVAVRLRPGKGVHAMRPIRVSWKGATPSLPLRMVAAGVGANVGIKLFVIGDGRWRAKNFATYEIDPGMLSWDFQIGRSTYTDVRKQLANGFAGRAFAMEASLQLSAGVVPPPDPPDPDPPSPDAGTDATDAMDASEIGPSDTGPSDGGSSDSDADLDASDASDASDTLDSAPAPDTTPLPYDAGAPPGIDPSATDREIAFGTLPTRRVTRLRADLPSKFLDTDLDLEADEAQSTVDNTLVAKHYTHPEVPCPQGVDDTATTAAALADDPTAGKGPQAQSCIVSEGPLSDVRLPALFGAVALVFGLRRLRRRRA